MNVLIFDGSFLGLLTAVYEAYYSFPETELILSEKLYCDNLLYNRHHIVTDDLKASKVQDALIRKSGIRTLENIYFVYLSDCSDSYTKIYLYIRLAFTLGNKIDEHIYNQTVRELLALRQKVLNESHRFCGFIRFSSIENKFLYSSIEPDHNILELIADHFAKRFSSENFIIHDIKRGIALRYAAASETYDFIGASEEAFSSLKNYKDNFEELWKTYYEYTTIKERINLKLQNSKMPERYWKHITEIHN